MIIVFQAFTLVRFLLSYVLPVSVFVFCYWACISHHQTSEQGGQWLWSCWSYSRYSHGDYVTWSKRWTGSAAGDWSYNWPPQVVSHRDECYQDDDHRCPLPHAIADCPSC